MALLDQLRDVCFFQKEFIEPGDLREHLQVGEVLRLKVLLGPLGGCSVLAEAVPQLL